MTNEQVRRSTFTVCLLTTVFNSTPFSCPSVQELIQLELLCKNLYESTDAAERSKAEASLNVFYMSPDCLQKCQLLLERGDVSSKTMFKKHHHINSSPLIGFLSHSTRPLHTHTVFLCSAARSNHTNQTAPQKSVGAAFRHPQLCA